LQQLCRPFVDRVPDLPAPQRDALDAAFGFSAGRRGPITSSDWQCCNSWPAFADDHPLLCVIDDAQWLDRVSVQTIAFVARRLLAEPFLFVVALRDSADDGDWAGLPELRLRGLNDTDAAVLFDSV